MKKRFSQTCSAAANGGSVWSFAPSYADSLPGTDAENASVLFVSPLLPAALPVSVLRRGADAGENTVD